MRGGAAERIENARAVKPFENVSDLARRAQLNRHDLQVLAATNALQSLASNRREALCQSVAAVPDRDPLRMVDWTIKHPHSAHHRKQTTF
jgi:error-prone DNA polymerase